MAASVDLFDSTYRHFQSRVLAEVRRETFGEDIGQNSWLTLDEYDRFLAWLQLQPGRHVLEVAAGSGGPAMYLMGQTDCHVTGIDTNAHAIATAQRAAQAVPGQYRVSFQTADANLPLPFPTASFDALVCIDSMNHFANRLGVLWEWRRVLRPGARAVFTDPVVISGPVSNEQLALRSCIGSFLFVPQGANEHLIELAGLRLLQKQDVTANAAIVAGRWHRARERHRHDLLAVEGEDRFAGLQSFLECVERLALERRLSRIAYLVEKPA